MAFVVALRLQPVDFNVYVARYKLARRHSPAGAQPLTPANFQRLVGRCLRQRRRDGLEKAVNEASPGSS